MNGRKYEIIQVPDDAADQIEAMGTKPKFWFRHATLGRCLYKQSRAGTGEDWAEKVASELAALLELPHATFELAAWRGISGTISPSFIGPGQRLVHGNELLFMTDPDYPAPMDGSPRFYRVTEHTLDAVEAALSKVSVPPHLMSSTIMQTGFDVFVGYLMLDALIGNTDRHHENWGIVAEPGSSGTTGPLTLYVAPTFDHASSLGRELTDDERSERLNTRDKNRTVAAYSDKARSALYRGRGDPKPLTTLEAFREAALRRPEAAQAWLRKLDPLRPDRVVALLDRVPVERFTAPAREFAVELLGTNQRRLIDVAEQFT